MLLNDCVLFRSQRMLSNGIVYKPALWLHSDGRDSDASTQSVSSCAAYKTATKTVALKIIPTCSIPWNTTVLGSVSAEIVQKLAYVWSSQIFSCVAAFFGGVSFTKWFRNELFVKRHIQFIVLRMWLQTMLNHCADDIESFVKSVQQAASAQKELERRRMMYGGQDVAGTITTVKKCHLKIIKGCTKRFKMRKNCVV